MSDAHDLVEAQIDRLKELHRGGAIDDEELRDGIAELLGAVGADVDGARRPEGLDSEPVSQEGSGRQGAVGNGVRRFVLVAVAVLVLVAGLVAALASSYGR